jgi:Ca2+-binding EF-hand superfamily protein
VANSKRNNWVGIWKSIKKIDKDSNGFVTIDELDEIFREWFPLEMESKTLNRFFRKKYGSVSNRNLINYKQLKLDIQSRLQIQSSDTPTPIDNKKRSLTTIKKERY